MSVSIENLEVRLEVEGGEEEEVFARLFRKHIRQWHRLQRERRSHRRHAERERVLGDRSLEEFA